MDVGGEVQWMWEVGCNGRIWKVWRGKEPSVLGGEEGGDQTGETGDRTQGENRGTGCYGVGQGVTPETKRRRLGYAGLASCLA